MLQFLFSFFAQSYVKENMNLSSSVDKYEIEQVLWTLNITDKKVVIEILKKGICKFKFSKAIWLN